MRASPGLLDAKYYYLPGIAPKSSGIRPLKFLLHHIEMFQQIWARARQVKNILRRENCGALVACTGDLIDMPAGFLASQMANIPFYAYIFDDYVFQWTSGRRQFAKLVAPFIFKHCAGVIGPNEYICTEYQRRYGVHPTLVRNPCDKDELEKEPYSQWPGENEKIKIIYTGAIYRANFDCFRNLVKAMDSLKESSLELHIFTSQTRRELEDQDIKSDRLFLHSHLPYSEIFEQQRRADILFLPLAFESPIPEVIRTSAPSKMGEYLASGRPVLAHVPADSFVAYYFKKNQCGWLADQNNPNHLVSVIKNIILDQELHTTTIENALQQAKIDFSPVAARDQFLRMMDNQ
ncbi:MAG TPA: glycosyltransferase [Anaerolineaceae bacterium]|nr:glycosyltransferase [Anaerolineaceae bacterium]